MKQTYNLTEGKIAAPLLRFALPVLFALFLQAAYGAADLIVVGKFAEAADVSAVSTGSQIMMMITELITSLSMGMTISIGHRIGEKRYRDGGRTVGSGVIFFALLGTALTASLIISAKMLAGIMQAPQEAFSLTADYVAICGGGSIVIVAYNLIGSVFRGLGDSKTPLLTVAAACMCNIAGDIIAVGFLGMGARGAALSTVLSQMISVIISALLIKRSRLPIEFDRSMLKWDWSLIKKILLLGVPIAIQDALVGISFLVILAIVNSLGLIVSAGVGVAEKVCAFIMLVPMSFMQSMSAFTAHNIGAGKMERAVKALIYSIEISLSVSVVIFYVSFFHGDILSGIFAKDAAITAAAADYLKSYAFDCLLTSFLFCFIGFFNGMEKTKFVMAQGIFGSFCVRIPVSFLISRLRPVSLFAIGLASPCSTLVQITLCFGFWVYLRKQYCGLRSK